MRSRADYERHVRALGHIGEWLLASGESVEAVARLAVVARNTLKREFRQELPDDLLAAIEQRNFERYGDPLGPTAEHQIGRYGTWEAVLAAAARPGRFP